ncbi:MAG: tyrosine-type recombinase/integrase [Gammaproteobacteria bacterium]
MPLTDTRIRNAKPTEKPYKLADGGGLYIEVKPNGSKLWRLRYRLARKENVFAIGAYPVVSLAGARAARDAAKKLIRDSIHPAHHRRLERVRKANEHANTFESVAREWLNYNREHWTEKTLQQRKRALERDVFPAVGSLPMKQVSPAHVLSVVKNTEKRAPAMAGLVNQVIGADCRYAVVTLRADGDATNPLRGALKPRQVEHSRPLSRDEIPGFFRALEAYPGHFSNKSALRLMWLTLARTVEVTEARWCELDLEAALWHAPAARMKAREPHTVPLSWQAVALLESLKRITGNGEYLFPNRDNLSKPVSQGVLWKAFVSLGYLGRFSPHGIRATGSTFLNEMGYRSDVIECQLAHRERDRTRASYNAAQYLEERRQMMQHWADYLDALCSGGNVVAIRRA